MAWVEGAGAVALILVVFIDAFEAIILPRRVRHPFRLSRLFYQSTWWLWRKAARLIPAGRRRQSFLSIFGPLSLFGLLATWAVGLIAGFALLHWSVGTPLTYAGHPDNGFDTCLYFSGTTFFTLGYGDVVPTSTWGRASGVAEAGIGFAFLAVVISYLPILYQAFSRREISISLLDARAGSPPTASELLRRLARGHSLASAGPLLAEWERWAAELLESNLSYPVLRYYRSQHDNQSWLAALTTMLDVASLLIAAVDGPDGHQARLTFAMARHAAVDLSLVSQTPPLPPQHERLPLDQLERLKQALREAGIAIHDGSEPARALGELRSLYEPFVNALAEHFQFALPPFQPDRPPVDNWQTSAWTRRSPELGGLPGAGIGEEHFD